MELFDSATREALALPQRKIEVDPRIEAFNSDLINTSGHLSILRIHSATWGCKEFGVSHWTH